MNFILMIMSVSFIHIRLSISHGIERYRYHICLVILDDIGIFFD